MKHTLAAAAVLASLFAGNASAQSSVTVYGLLDAGLTSEHGAVPSPSWPPACSRAAASASRARKTWATI